MSEYNTGHACHENCCTKDHYDHRSESHHGESCEMSEDLLYLLKSAKHELLKEKMKQILEVKIGTKLYQVAEAAVDAALLHWQQKAAEKQACEQYQEKLTAVFKG